jgi:hypothetical protein
MPSLSCPLSSAYHLSLTRRCLRLLSLHFFHVCSLSLPNQESGLKLKKLKAKSAKKFETEESATLELQCLVLTEQLKTTRIQRIYYLDKLKKSGRVIEEERYNKESIHGQNTDIIATKTI